MNTGSLVPSRPINRDNRPILFPSALSWERYQIPACFTLGVRAAAPLLAFCSKVTHIQQACRECPRYTVSHPRLLCNLGPCWGLRNMPSPAPPTPTPVANKSRSTAYCDGKYFITQRRVPYTFFTRSQMDEKSLWSCGGGELLGNDQEGHNNTLPKKMTSCSFFVFIFVLFCFFLILRHLLVARSRKFMKI